MQLTTVALARSGGNAVGSVETTVTRNIGAIETLTLELRGEGRMFRDRVGEGRVMVVGLPL